jgi:hypothetical protein
MIFFKKVCDFTIPKRASMQWSFSTKKENQADFCKTTFETAIRNQNLSDGEMFLSMFQILDKSQPKRTDNKTSVYW